MKDFFLAIGEVFTSSDPDDKRIKSLIIYAILALFGIIPTIYEGLSRELQGKDKWYWISGILAVIFIVIFVIGKNIYDNKVAKKMLEEIEKEIGNKS